MTNVPALTVPEEPSPTGAGLGTGQTTLLRWALRRLGFSVLILLGVSILVFAATQALPGDPAQQILGRNAAPEQLAALRKELGLDQPLVSQYWHWLRGVLTGSPGNSISSHEPVTTILRERGLASFALVLLSAVIAIPTALLIGTVSAVKRDRKLDHATQVGVLVLTAMPEFVIGLGLLILFATSVFEILPAVAIIPPGESAFAHPKELALPVLTLVLAVIPYLTRLQRAAMIDVLESEYVQMARLKGVPEGIVIGRHAMRNSVIPIIQGSALTLIYLTGGIVTIEYLFAYPGLGSGLTMAVSGRDLPVVQAIVLLLASTYVIFNLIADLLTVLLTPRLRTQYR